jgi:curli biogenesis system outer membrane secretion channel CsgG
MEPTVRRLAARFAYAGVSALALSAYVAFGTACFKSGGGGGGGYSAPRPTAYVLTPAPPRPTYPAGVDVSVKALDVEAHPPAALPRRARVAIMPFRASRGSGAGSLVADALILRLRGRGVDVIDRGRIERVMREQGLIAEERTGLSDLEVSRRLGKLVQADYLIFGAVTEFDLESERVELSPVVPPAERTRYVTEYNRYRDLPDAEQDPELKTLQEIEYELAKEKRQQCFLTIANAGVTARIVSVKTSKVVWVGIANAADESLQAATTRIVDGFVGHFLDGKQPKEELREKVPEPKLPTRPRSRVQHPDPPELAYPDVKDQLVKPVLLKAAPPNAVRPRQRIAVMAFDDAGRIGSGNLVADTIVMRLQRRGFQVIDRDQIAQVMQEQGLLAEGRTKLSDLEVSKRLGKLVQADYFLFGSVVQYHARTTAVPVPGVIPPAERKRYMEEFNAWSRANGGSVSPYDVVDAEMAGRPISGNPRFPPYRPKTLREWEYAYQGQTRFSFVRVAHVGVTGKLVRTATSDIEWVGFASATDLRLQRATGRVVGALMDHFLTGGGQGQKPAAPVAMPAIPPPKRGAKEQAAEIARYEAQLMRINDSRQLLKLADDLERRALGFAKGDPARAQYERMSGRARARAASLELGGR